MKGLNDISWHILGSIPQGAVPNVEFRIVDRVVYARMIGLQSHSKPRPLGDAIPKVRKPPKSWAKPKFQF